MNKVYVVHFYYYSDYNEIAGVFTSKEEAEQFAFSLIEQSKDTPYANHRYNTLSIWETELNSKTFQPVEMEGYQLYKEDEYE
jgi:hypothetical protein